MVSRPSFRRLAVTGAILFVVVALVVTVGVIPPVKADTFPRAAPEGAAAAFWIVTGLNVLAAAALWRLATLATGLSAFVTSALRFGSFFAFLLTVAFIDAGAAFSGHGPAMRTTVILLFFCAAVEAAVAVLLVVASIRRPEQA